MSVKRISKVEELFPALYEIGSFKNELPMELRGWVNVLDLYVQLRDMQTLMRISVKSATDLAPKRPPSRANRPPLGGLGGWSSAESKSV